MARMTQLEQIFAEGVHKLPDIKVFLDRKVEEYNRPSFIENDPISIPHRFARKQDREIAAFFAAILAWGQRKTIINKCTELLARMDGQPYDFVRNHQEIDRSETVARLQAPDVQRYGFAVLHQFFPRTLCAVRLLRGSLFATNRQQGVPGGIFRIVPIASRDRYVFFLKLFFGQFGAFQFRGRTDAESFPDVFFQSAGCTLAYTEAYQFADAKLCL